MNKQRMYGHGYDVWTNRMYGENVWTWICMDKQNVWRDCRDIMYGQQRMYGHGYDVWTNRMYGENVWTWI